MTHIVRLSQTCLHAALLSAAILVLLTGCSGSSKDLQDQLAGQWGRADGDYTLEITGAGDEGELTVAYLNPTPIHVGRAAWRMKEDILQLYVELRDENYPGSLYQLSYDPESDVLYGTYYQAVSRQTYEVYFTRKK